MSNKKKDNKKNKKQKVWNVILKLIDLSGVFLSIVAIIHSNVGYNFTKNMSPLTYSYNISQDISVNISNDDSAEVSFNISDVIIDLNDNPGKISEIYIADIFNNSIDIYNYKGKGSEICILNDNLMIKFEYNKKRIMIGFNRLVKLKSGYFFVVFKSFSGEYYYNILHYITGDKSEYDEESGLYFTNTKVNFLKLLNIYNLNDMKEICDEINNKSYTIDKLDYGNYLLQIESDYKLLKDKIEG